MRSPCKKDYGIFGVCKEDPLYIWKPECALKKLPTSRHRFSWRPTWGVGGDVGMLINLHVMVCSGTSRLMDYNFYWVVVKELSFSYYIREGLLVTI